MPRLEAEAELRARRADSVLTADSYHDLVLAATGGDKKKAERAFCNFRAAELRSGKLPEGEGAG